MVDKQEYEALVAAYKTQTSAFVSLKFRLEQLEKMIFGRKSEKYTHLKDPQQLSLLPEDVMQNLVVEQETKQVTTTIVNKVKKPRPNHPGRKPFPPNLPIEEIRLEPTEDISQMKYIGDEVTETLDYVEAILKIQRIIRPKYLEQTISETTKKPIKRIVIAELPSRPIRKGIAEAGLLSHIFVCKYIDHLPFYRIIERFKRDYNWDLSRTTVSGWFAACCRLLKPLYNLLKQKILDTDYLMVDETSYKVQEDGKAGKCFNGWFWLYENPHTKLVIYDYRKDRSAANPLEMLADFSGHIHVDGYTSYPVVERKLPITLLVCWAHARRKFVEAYNYDKKGVDEIVQLIKGLYKVEKELRLTKANHRQRYELRQLKSKPILDKIALWMKDNAAKYPPSSPVAKAIQYSSSRWKELVLYTSDGKFEIDNNLVENSVRPVALGRKNYLFAGSHEAARNAGMMYSFFTCCKRNNVNPFNWLKDVLQRIPEQSIQNLDMLLPDQWIDASV